jgi:hypothetical protein
MCRSGKLGAAPAHSEDKFAFYLKEGLCLLIKFLLKSVMHAL